MQSSKSATHCSINLISSCIAITYYSPRSMGLHLTHLYMSLIQMTVLSFMVLPSVSYLTSQNLQLCEINIIIFNVEIQREDLI